MSEPVHSSASLDKARELLESQRLLNQLCKSEHSQCLFCGQDNPIGFKLEFRVQKPGSVNAVFPCGRFFCSYPSTLHGGVTSALLDAAMTHSLFSIGVVAVTGELVVRFAHPVETECEAEVFANIEKSCSPLYCLTAELRQHGKIAARATGKFVNRNWSLAQWQSSGSKQGESIGAIVQMISRSAK